MKHTDTRLNAEDQCIKRKQKQNPRHPPLQDFQIYKALCVCVVQDAGQLETTPDVSIQTLHSAVFVYPNSCTNRVLLLKASRKIAFACCSQRALQSVVVDVKSFFFFFLTGFQ